MRENLRAVDFFDVLFRGLDGWAVVCTFPGGIFDHNYGPTEERWFEWPRQRDALAMYCYQNRNHDLYTTPILYKESHSRKAGNAKCGQFIWADADTAQPEWFAAIPTIEVRTSSYKDDTGKQQYKHHLYWQVTIHTDDGTTDPDTLARMGRRVAHAHAAEGCDTGGWDVGQLLRVPGSRNNKPELDAPFDVTGGYMRDRAYLLDAFGRAYPNVPSPAPNALSGEAMPDPATLISFDEALALFFEQPDLFELVTAHVSKEEGNRSARMWKLLCECARMGIPRETAFVLGLNAGCNKYRQDGRPDSDLWAEVCRAYEVPENAPPLTELDFEEQEVLRAFEAQLEQINDNALVSNPTYGSSIRLIHDVEQVLVPHDTIVDRYVAWAGRRTDAASQYQRAGVLQVLSCVFSEFGRPATKFPMGGLNLWFLVLGGTTRSRKSTARHMMLDLLHGLENDGYHYDIGSDVTAEGLNVELADRPNQSVLFHRDEVHGMLTEQGSKNYLAGLQETLTELYDGRVRGRLRATGNTKKTTGSKVNFCMWLSGTTEQVTDRLTIDDFNSGFLARIIFVVAEPPERTPESVRMDQESGNRLTQKEDPEWDQLLLDVSSARSYWSSLTTRGNQVPIRFETNAWERFNEFAWDLGTLAADHELASVLEPTVDRLGKSVLKVACLLAMARCATEVQMPDVLKAITFAEEWYVYTATIAEQIQASYWQQQQNDVEEMLSSFGELVLHSKAYAKVRNKFRPKEFDEVLSALAAAGKLTRAVDPTTGARIIKKIGSW